MCDAPARVRSHWARPLTRAAGAGADITHVPHGSSCGTQTGPPRRGQGTALSIHKRQRQHRTCLKSSGGRTLRCRSPFCTPPGGSGCTPRCRRRQARAGHSDCGTGAGALPSDRPSYPAARTQEWRTPAEKERNTYEGVGDGASQGEPSEGVGGTFGRSTLFHTATDHEPLDCTPSKAHNCREEGEGGMMQIGV